LGKVVFKKALAIISRRARFGWVSGCRCRRAFSPSFLSVQEGGGNLYNDSLACILKFFSEGQFEQLGQSTRTTMFYFYPETPIVAIFLIRHLPF